MDVTTNEIEKIARTLPVGYYAKRKIEVDVKEGEDTSYYSPMEDAIVISADIIKTAMANYPADYDKEKAVRSMLYHEVSHAILTPRYASPTKIYNIFEDERIETLLGNYYMDVDFKEQVYAINPNYHGQAPTNAFQAFYMTVRFRSGFAEDLAEVDRIIERYSTLNHNDPNWDNCDYENKIVRLYKQVCSHYNFPPESGDMSGMRGNDGTAMNGGIQADADGEMTEAEAEEAREEAKGKTNSNKGFSKQAMDNAIKSFGEISGKYVDKSLTDRIQMLFNSYNKRTSNNGSCLNGYSGIFDPRSVMRDDYKYFIRKNSRGNGKGFSKFNLNLFIDSSGSFQNNVEAVNTIIKSLMEIEKMDSMFTFTLTAIDHDIHEMFGAKRVHYACGGSQLTSKLAEVYRKKQKADAVNYNIALFDGQMDNSKYFSAFNNNNCTIIAEHENEKAIRRYCPTAKLLIEDRHYAEKLKENILQILTIALG